MLLINLINTHSFLSLDKLVWFISSSNFKILSYHCIFNLIGRRGLLSKSYDWLVVNNQNVFLWWLRVEFYIFIDPLIYFLLYLLLISNFKCCFTNWSLFLTFTGRCYSCLCVLVPYLCKYLKYVHYYSLSWQYINRNGFPERQLSKRSKDIDPCN